MESSRSKRTQNLTGSDVHKTADLPIDSGAKNSAVREANCNPYPRAVFPTANLTNATATQDVENRPRPAETTNRNDSSAQAPEKRSWVEKALIQALRTN